MPAYSRSVLALVLATTSCAHAGGEGQQPAAAAAVQQPARQEAAAPQPDQQQVVQQQTRQGAVFEHAFVSLTDVDPSIVVEARYFGGNNFLGRPVTGYEAPKCLLTRQAADALAAAQAELRAFGLGLKTYDCYRPQRAVDDFVRWARDTADTAMKAAFYPRVDKRNLFSDGYIADRSGHSRGSTVDLTLVPLAADAAAARRAAEQALQRPSVLADCALPADRRTPDTSLDMGTGYDCFDPLSHTENPAVSGEARRNRLLLRAVMEKHGFRNYPREWWHFTLREEPFPTVFFDHPVR